jgi:hypothetical protein
VVGTLGYIAGPALWGDPERPLTAAWLVTWMTDPQHRSGLGIALLQDVRRRIPVLLGIEGAEQTLRIFERLGWKVRRRLPRLLRVFDAERAMGIALPGVDLAGIRALASPVERVDAAATAWDARSYAPEWKRYPSLAYGTLRDAAFLQWRYCRHPVYDFEIVAAGEPHAPSIAVYRIETARGAGVRVGRLIEFFHPEGDAGRRSGKSLVRAVTARFVDAGCTYADCITSSAEYEATLVAAGWFAEGEAQLLPVRLQPPERSPFAYNLEYGAATTAAHPPVEALYAGRGDGDADRPPSGTPAPGRRS